MFADTDQLASATRDPVAPATRSKAALAKAGRHTPDDGTPVHRFSTLMAELAIIVRCRTPHAGPDAPRFSDWVLDWAHIGRMLRYVDQAITPLAYGRLTADGTAFEPWDLFVRFRSLVWTGEAERWQELGDRAVSAA
jgi:hypothetical protein